MSINSLHCAIEFYTLESLADIVSSQKQYGRKSHEKLMQDIDDFKAEYIPRLANAIYDYTALVVYGEMRHGWSQSTHYNPHVKKGGSRSCSYEEAKAFNPSHILKAGNTLFESGDWVSNFGGEKWAFISDRVMLRDRLIDPVFCDMCFSLSHNSSPYLDKYNTGIFWIQSVTGYKRFLDFKFSCKKPITLLATYASKCGYHLRKLIKRAVVLGFVGDSIWFEDEFNGDEAEAAILSYSRIDWGMCYLEDEVINHRDNLDDNPDRDNSYARRIRYETEGYSEVRIQMVTPFSNYYIGDEVEIAHTNHTGNGLIHVGMKGKVVCKQQYNSLQIGVEFYEHMGGHDLEGEAKRGHGWWCSCNDIKKIALLEGLNESETQEVA